MFNIGLRIKEIRKIKGFSQKEIALGAKMTQSFLAGIENDNKKCSIDNLEKICAALNISLRDFFDIEQTSVNAEITELSPEQLSKLNDFINSLKV